MRKMWAAAPYQQRRSGEPNCWDARRDATRARQDASTYFAETWSGTHCGSNWYEGNPGQLGESRHVPTFNADAPALLGFDETIDEYCAAQPKRNGHPEGGHWHASQCIASNLNILSLYGDRVPYNLCRNLEWQLCGAAGKLPGQREANLVFSKAPKDLDPRPSSSKPFGQCRGWREPAQGDCSLGYATDDIFFLEACVFNQICSNNDELWTLEAGVLWQCRLNATRFEALQAMLVAEPDWGAPRGLFPRCDEWCNAYTCSQPACLGCGADIYAQRRVGCS